MKKIRFPQKPISTESAVCILFLLGWLIFIALLLLANCVANP